MTTMFIVYAPALGYSVDPDNGKLFRLSTEAEQFVMRLRHNGHAAWVETLQVSFVAPTRKG